MTNHAHMLAIHKDPNVLQEYHKTAKQKNITSFILTTMGWKIFRNDAIVALNTASGKKYKPHPSSIIQRTNWRQYCMSCLLLKSWMQWYCMRSRYHTYIYKNYYNYNFCIFKAHFLFFYTSEKEILKRSGDKSQMWCAGRKQLSIQIPLAFHYEQNLQSYMTYVKRISPPP
jgi:hypothetical protein